MPTAGESVFGKGQKIEAKRADSDTFCGGRIHRVRINRVTFDVIFDDGVRVDGIDQSDIRVADTGYGKLEVGQRIDAKKQRKLIFYPGRVIRARENGTYDVRYQTGELEYRVERKLIRVSGERQPTFTCLKGLEHIEEKLRTNDINLINVEAGLSVMKKKLLGIGVEVRYDVTGNVAGEAVTTKEIEEEVRQQQIAEQEEEDARKGILNSGQYTEDFKVKGLRRQNATPEQVAQQLEYQKQAYRRQRQLWRDRHQFKQEPSKEEVAKMTKAKEAEDERKAGLAGKNLLRLAENVRTNDASVGTTLALRCRQIDDDKLHILSEHLRSNKTLHTIDLSHNYIGGGGASELLEVILIAAHSRGTLTRLNLNDNHIDEGGGTSLGKVLGSNATLVHVEIGRGPGLTPEELKKYGMLHRDVHKQAKRLGTNCIGITGADKIARGLKVNSTLTALNLSGNRIGDHGCSYLCAGLLGVGNGSALTYLDMSRNGIGETGGCHLAACLLAPTAAAGTRMLRARGVKLPHHSHGGRGGHGGRGRGRGQRASEAEDDGAGDGGSDGSNPPLTALDLGRNAIGGKATTMLAESLATNLTLTCLDLRHNCLAANGHGWLYDEFAGFTSLMRTLFDADVGSEYGHEGQGAESLHMASVSAAAVQEQPVGDGGAGMGTGAGADSTSGAASPKGYGNSTLTSLNIASNRVWDEGAMVCAEMLEQNDSLTHLDLSMNKITDTGAARIERSLHTNLALTSLDLRQNEFGAAGAEAFAKCMEDVNADMTCLNISGCPGVDLELRNRLRAACQANVLVDLDGDGDADEDDRRIARERKRNKEQHQLEQRFLLHLKQAFYRADLDHSGTIDEDEQWLLFQQAGFDIHDARVQKYVEAAWRKMDVDGDGQVDLDEFLSVATEMYGKILEPDREREKEERQRQLASAEGGYVNGFSDSDSGSEDY